jgi:tRNA (guanine37-N1)-methyltransferase
MRIDIITIFPGYFAPLSMSLIGKAAERGDIEFAVHDLRQWARDVHHTVDDTPYGGGPGMVMKPEPWGDALDAVLLPAAIPALPPAEAVPSPAAIVPSAEPTPSSAVTPPPAAASSPGHGGEPSVRLVVPSPSGRPFSQDMAAAYARVDHLVFACGRYEGIDTRVVEEARTRVPVDEVSIGDYVLAGGESAVLVMIEAICRLLPGVLGNAGSVADDSFGAGGGEMAGLLEGPLYTRPRVWRGREVPPVLLSGDHAAIARWRRDAALRRTVANRPDLAARLTQLDARDRQILDEASAPSPPAPDVAAPRSTARNPTTPPAHEAAAPPPAHRAAAPADSGVSGAGELVSEPGFPVGTEDMAH